MRPPVQEIVGNLIWATDGSVWAAWRVEPDSYPYLSAQAKLDLHARTRAVLMSLHTESMLLGLCEPIDPTAVVEGMTQGVDISAHPEWAEVALAALDDLVGQALWRRCFFLVVRLAQQSEGAKAWSGALRAAQSQVLGAFGVHVPPVSGPEVGTRAQQAKQLGHQIVGRLRARPATAGELRWIYARAARRGVDDPVLTPDWEPAGAGRRPVRLAHMLPDGEATLTEGGSDDDEGRPKHRRYVRVEVPGLGRAYQTALVVSDMPRRWSFPGGAGEWFAHLDGTGFQVDWCARVRPVRNEAAQVKARRRHRQLAQQVDEHSGETTGPPSSLEEALAAMDDERAELAANPADSQLLTTIVFSTWAPDLRDLESQADRLTSMFAPLDYQLFRPTGGQIALLRAALPGAVLPAVARDYTQYLFARDLAAGSPFAGSDLGDPQGVYFAKQADGVNRPVLVDPAYGPQDIDSSGSMALFGPLGRGKSHMVKLVIAGVLARGGQVVVTDRTQSGEYARLAQATAGTSQVVKIGVDAERSLDPLAVFAGPERRARTIGFLTVLLGTAPLEADGLVLSQAVSEVVDRPGGRLIDVVEVLEGRTGNARAEEVAGKLREVLRTPLGATVFAPGPPVSLDADYIVFAAQGLNLPERDHLMNPHLARRLLPEQILGQALLYLVTAVTRAVTWKTVRRFSLGVLDEVWALTRTVEGQALIEEQIHDGRKHNAALVVAGHDPEGDLPNEHLRALIPVRACFRADDRASAGRFASFVGVEGSDDVLALLTDPNRLGQGECLYRDVRGRTGVIKVLPAWSAELARAMESNPKRVSQQSPGPVGPAPAPGPDGSARQYLGGARAASAAERRGPGTAADLDLRRRPVRQRPVPSA